MKNKLILVEKSQTVESLLQQYDLVEDFKSGMMKVAIDDKMVQSLDQILIPQQQIRIFPAVSGGSEDSFTFQDLGNRIEIGNSYTSIEVEKQEYEDKMALKLARFNFIKELEKVANPDFDVISLVDSKVCSKCNRKLHIPDSWQRRMKPSEKLRYFKMLVKIGQTSPIMCCSCYYTIMDSEEK